MSQEQQYKNKEQAATLGTETQKNGAFDATVASAEKKQKNWFQRWGNRFTKAFDYVHEKSVAFNEKGFDTNDMVRAAKKLEDGGFGDGTKIAAFAEKAQWAVNNPKEFLNKANETISTKLYKFFAEGGYKTINGIRDTALEGAQKLKDSRMNLSKRVEALRGTKNGQEVHNATLDVNKLAGNLLVQGDNFIITSMTRQRAAEMNKNTDMNNAKYAYAAANGHSSAQHAGPKMDMFKNFANMHGGGHGAHDHGGDHH